MEVSLVYFHFEMLVNCEIVRKDTDKVISRIWWCGGGGLHKWQVWIGLVIWFWKFWRPICAPCLNDEWDARWVNTSQSSRSSFIINERLIDTPSLFGCLDLLLELKTYLNQADSTDTHTNRGVVLFVFLSFSLFLAFWHSCFRKESETRQEKRKRERVWLSSAGIFYSSPARCIEKNISLHEHFEPIVFVFHQVPDCHSKWPSALFNADVPIRYARK